MKTFYLQKRGDGSLFIDERPHAGHEQVRSVEAETWKAAKAIFTKPAKKK